MSVKKLVINGEEHSIEAENGWVKTVNGVAWDVLLQAWENVRIENNVFSATNTTYSAWKWIEIKDVDYSPIQWPCPDGYHIPSKDECDAIKTILVTVFGLESKKTTLQTYLKIPPRWVVSDWINYSWSDPAVLTVTNNNGTSPYHFWGSNYWLWTYTWQKKAWYQIRPFKDIPEIPNNTWTTLYDWSSIANWAWVFHNSTLWLISISWDWQTWITITDKNLWATTIYNDWDTLSEANCGYFYQRWNIYWFPYSWATTTSSTQVDATNYWPWNYYSSDTFITQTNWDSSNNKNLRWWVTGVLKNAITNQWWWDGIGRTLYVKYKSASQKWVIDGVWNAIDEIKNNVVLVFSWPSLSNFPTRIYDSDDNYIDIYSGHSPWNASTGVLLGIIKVENDTFHFYPRYWGIQQEQ